MNELQNKYRNVSQGTRQIQNIISSQKDDVRFNDKEIELLMTLYPDRKIQDYEYLIIMTKSPYYKKTRDMLMNVS